MKTKININTTSELLREYLTGLNAIGAQDAGFVLEHGRAFQQVGDIAPYLPTEQTIKQCFRNAWHLSMKHPELVYCEGYALSMIPVLHAWCWDPVTDTVLDPTWTGDRQGVAYIGVPFRLSYVTETIKKRGYFGVIDNPEDKFALVRGEHKPSEFMYQIQLKPI